jgi:toxoflavin synthase
MSTNYDLIAEQYRRSKLTPWRTYIEQYTLLELLGDLRGKSVLDLACGEGY